MGNTSMEELRWQMMGLSIASPVTRGTQLEICRHFFPAKADFVLKINPESEEVTTIGPRFEGHNKSPGHAFSPSTQQ